jgi:hypothetical protein
MQLIVARPAEENHCITLVTVEILSNPWAVVQLARDQMMSRQSGSRPMAERTSGHGFIGWHSHWEDVEIDRRRHR